MNNQKIEKSGETINIINQLENWLKENHRAANHLIRTGYWLKEMYPQADDAMIIAAIAHDLERIFPLKEGEVQPPNLDWDNEEYLLWHGTRSAKFLEKYLKDNGASSALIEKVNSLVAYHEVGGDEKKDMIKDADSVSFLETQVDKFIGRIRKGEKTAENIKKKFDYMFNRISSEKVREIAKPFYDTAINKLNSIL